MTSSDSDRQNDRAGSPSEPDGIAARVSRISSQPPPAPPGRGIVMALLAVAVGIAVIVQFTTKCGPGQQVRERVEEERRAAAVAPPERPPETPAETPAAQPERPPVELVPAEGAPGEAEIFRPPGADIPVPEGLSDRTARQLRLSLAALRQATIIAADGVRGLAELAVDAPEADRAALRLFVIERLAALAGDTRLGVNALDAGLQIAAHATEGLGPLASAARDPGLREDRTTAAALLFLDALAPEERGAAVPDVWKVAKDGGRLLHLRVMAARSLTRWNEMPAERATLAGESSTPVALARALGAE